MPRLQEADDRQPFPQPRLLPLPARSPQPPPPSKPPKPSLTPSPGGSTATGCFSPGRTELLTAQVPASDAEAAGRRDQAAALTAQVKKLDAQQAAQIRALEDVPDGAAGQAMRARITERFTELHAERTAAEAKLAALISERPRAADAASLEEVPTSGTSSRPCRPPSKPACSP